MTTLLRIWTALLAVGAVLAITTTALAGETRTWDNERYTAKGYAKGSVTIDFLSKRAFDVNGYVEDKCPKDGYGAYLHVTHMSVNRYGYGAFEDWTTFKDSNGCGNGAKPFD